MPPTAPGPCWSTFLEVIVGTDVRLIISGHNHHEGVGTLASVPVRVSPASSYRLDVLSREMVGDPRLCMLTHRRG